MRTIKGLASRGFSPIMGEISLQPRPFYRRSQTIFVAESLGGNALGYKGCITSGSKGRFFHPDHIYDVAGIEQLHNGDIACLNRDGSISILWEINSQQNALLLTESCNCRCLMCPQPPRLHSPALIQQAENILNLLRGKDIESICITGGEPTLPEQGFFKILKRCVEEHPHAIISILTNGKRFSNSAFARQASNLASKNVIFCVSLHSDIDTIHDEIVGKKGSYSATQQGIYNLATYSCNIEIRHVITKMNCTRLLTFAEQMYGYFPFCTHYALMGLEVCGHAAGNMGEIFIDPSSYKAQLYEAVKYFSRRRLPVSIYNVPLCLCESGARPFARQSISLWKNIYPVQCDPCTRKSDCAGFFSTAASLPLEHIKPLAREE